MKKNDKLLIMIVFIIGIIGYAIVQILQTTLADDNAIAIVSYDNTHIMRIRLIDGTYDILDETLIYRSEDAYSFKSDEDEDNPVFNTCFVDAYRYCVIGENGIVVIEYDNHQVTVIEETSPRNLCQTHGPTNSPAQPIICLPNRILISIESPNQEDDAYVRRDPWILYKPQ